MTQGLEDGNDVPVTLGGHLLEMLIARHRIAPIDHAIPESATAAVSNGIDGNGVNDNSNRKPEMRYKAIGCDAN